MKEVGPKRRICHLRLKSKSRRYSDIERRNAIHRVLCTAELYSPVGLTTLWCLGVPLALWMTITRFFVPSLLLARLAISLIVVDGLLEEIPLL